nr:hypothetical protein 7 [Desulfobacteraceae bacterium]
MPSERKNYNTTLFVDLIRRLKILAVEQDRRANDLIEEAIRDLLKKYGKSEKG